MSKIRKLLNSQYTYEVTFWGSCFIIIFLFLGHFHHDYFNTLLFCLAWFPFTICFTYYLNYILIQKYFQHKRYLKFIVYFLYSIIVNTYFQMLLVLGGFVLLSNLEYNKMNPILNDFSMLWFVQLLISAIYTAFLQIKTEQKRREKIYELEKEKLEISYQLKELELNTLKEQIHPHFLFNTLNNIYGLAIEKSDNLPTVLLQLSGLLDYLVYQSKEEKVLLEKEINLLQQYISLEKIRLDERFELNIHDHGIEGNKIYITPFLLFPMVENAFKHGIKKTSKKAYLNITTKYQDQEHRFTFVVENSKPLKIENTKSGGMGLINLQKRLKLFYPQKHDFYIEEEADLYRATLKILL